MSDDRWVGWLERLLFFLPVVVGAGVIGVLQRAPQPRLSGAAFAVAGVGTLAIRFGVPIAIWLDARRIERSGQPWKPNRWLYSGAALLISSPLVALVYLYRRHRRVPYHRPDPRWGYLVGGSLAVGVLAIASGVVAVAVAVTVGESAVPLVLTLTAVLAAIVAGVFPAAMYYDAAYVSARSRAWRPNPALYLGLALVGLFVGLLQPLVAGYYLLRRRRELDGQAASP